MSAMDGRSIDILVAGAGPAGASIARLLALRGRRVMLVDPMTRPTERLEVIAPAGVPALAALGLSHLMDDSAIARPCLGIRRRWGRADTEIDDFLRRSGGRGFVIDRLAFDNALRAAAAASGVTVLQGRLTAVLPDAGVMAATVATSSRKFIVSAGLIIDATGRSSAVARRLGVRKLMGEPLVAERRRSTQAHSDNASWLTVAGVEHGWSYAISGPGGRRERWAIYPPVRRARADARRRVDASAALLTRAAGERWIAVGDAAASFDPVTSQGLANALSTAIVAAGAILSPRGLDEEASAVYSDAVIATFRHSEAGRRRVYDALTMRTRPAELQR